MGESLNLSNDSELQAIRKRIFIFDLDGTIIDSITAFSKLFAEVLPSRFNVKLSKENQEKMKWEVLKLIQGKASKYLGLKVLWWYGNQMGLSFREKIKLLKILKEEYYKLIPRSPFYPDVHKTLQVLKDRGHILALNTSSSREELFDKFPIERRDFLKQFGNRIITRSDVKNLKPHPESILTIAKIAGMKPEDCVMVGDMELDIETGKNAGATTILVLTGFLKREDLERHHIDADFIVDSLSDIIKNLDKIENY